nr:hypothetical protein [Tanacetum cinerariifolium]
MVAILEKGEFNSDFHPMVDFIAASPLRYALTVKPTIFVSHIRQFWSTARIETTYEGTHILATVDGIQRTVSESSLRRNLKLRDKDGIIFIPDTELFENLTLMGGFSFLLAVGTFFTDSGNSITGSGNALYAINHLANLDNLQSSISSKSDHLPSESSSPLTACSRSLQLPDPSSEGSPSLQA